MNAYLFDARYEGQAVKFRANPEFGSREAAQVEVETFAHALGQMPAVLTPGIWYVNINAGEGSWYFSRDRRLITIRSDWESGPIEEALVLQSQLVSGGMGQP